jgi:hypothetical protein
LTAKLIKPALLAWQYSAVVSGCGSFSTTFTQISQSKCGLADAFVAAAGRTAFENIVDSHQVPRLEPSTNYLKIDELKQGSCRAI